MCEVRSSAATYQLVIIALMCLFISISSACPPPASQNDRELARYLFELRSNRQPDCEPGGDFLVDDEAINYSVESFCSQVEGYHVEQK